MAESLILLGAALAFFFGWNNSSFLIGGGRGSGTLTAKEALAVTSVGLLLGVALEGAKMTRSLSGSLVPAAGEEVLLVTLGVSLLIAVALTMAKLPASFSTTMVGAFVGAAFASSLTLHLDHLGLIVGFWLVAPAATALLTFALYRVASRALSRVSLLAVDQANRLGVIATSVVVAYALGANNIGLIYGTSFQDGSQPSILPMALLTVVAILGMLGFGRGGVAGTIGDRMVALGPQGVVTAFLSSGIVIWVGTELGVPISIGQCLLGGIFGAAFTKNITVVNRELALRMVSSWAVAPVLAFVVAAFLVWL